MIKIEIKSAEKCNGQYSIFVSFPYNYQIVETIRTFPTRYYDKENKVWELPLSKLNPLITKLNAQEFEIFAKEYILLKIPKFELPKGFKFKTEPKQHQIDGFEFGMTNSKWLLADDMGLGKSKQVIDIAVAKKQEGVKHCLVICCVNGLKWNWQNEIAKHSNEKCHILGMRKNGVGSLTDRLEDLQNIDKIKEYFIVTNIETIRYKVKTGNIIKKRGKETEECIFPITDKLVELIHDGEIGFIAVDEFHRCKDSQSIQGTQLLRLQTDYMIAMTGTPLMNTPIDLYIILKWLGYEKHSLYSFKGHYCILGGFNNGQILGYKNLDELHEQLSEIMLRRLKSEVLDLPDKTYIDEYVEMTPKQCIVYNEIKHEIKANIDQIKMKKNPLTELIRMQQATGYTGILSSKIKESAKLDRMEELIEEAVANNHQVVVFSNWTQITDIVYERLHAKYTLSLITGKVSEKVRQHNEKEFQEERSKILIGTIDALGTGLTLTAGTVEIFLDEPWNKAKKEQAVDRCHRIGQNENVTIYTIMCKGTIDERKHEVVEQKGEMADALVDGKFNIDKGQLVDWLVD